jgi:cytochrome o ubiquinol oxidase operon protein cyoD
MLSREHKWNRSLTPLVIGFLASLILTYLTYYLAPSPLVIFFFGLTQAILQLVFFLHLGLESKPHWNLITFLFLVLVIVIIVSGSLWIMYNLNYNMMI